jgi:glycosyltransferase involved in cell wall biosynthesis
MGRATAGVVYRDYPTLIRAVAGTPKVRLVIDPCSPWEGVSANGLDRLPDNVAITTNYYGNIRNFYAKASIIAVPIHNTTLCAAGMTLVLQAMAMGKPVIATATNGLGDILVHNTNCLVVAPGDEAGWRASIRRLSEDVAFATELGANARLWVMANASVDLWAERVVGSISQVI